MTLGRAKRCNSTPCFSPFAVRDGLLITGQQQVSGTAAAELVIEALGR